MLNYSDRKLWKYLEYQKILAMVSKRKSVDCFIKTRCQYWSNKRGSMSLAYINKGKKKALKLSRRKDLDEVCRVRHKLKTTDLKPLGITTLVYINDSLCFYYKNLWFKCKKLWANKSIFGYWVSNDSIKVRVFENSPVKIISHIVDLEKLFPDKRWSYWVETSNLLSFNFIKSFCLCICAWIFFLIFGFRLFIYLSFSLVQNQQRPFSAPPITTFHMRNQNFFFMLNFFSVSHRMLLHYFFLIIPTHRKLPTGSVL